MSFLGALSKAVCGLMATAPTNFLGTQQQIRTKFTNWQMIRDYKRRQLVKEHAIDRIRLNTVKRTDLLPFELREAASFELHNNFPRDSCFSRMRKRCMITSRPRGTVKRFRVSRIVFRHLADYNQLSGVQRAMW